MINHSENYINGKWVAASGTGTLAVTNPATDTVIAQVTESTAADVDAAVASARTAFESWSATEPSERAKYLQAIAQKLSEQSEELVGIISAEMGVPVTFARAAHLPLPINSFAQAAAILADFEFEDAYRGSTIVREPYGVIGAITPWNYPLHQIALKTAFGLAAGNTIVLKPSENTPLDAIALTKIIDSVGLPEGVFNVVFGTGPVVGEAIAAHPGVDAVSFTGSTRAGRRVGELASATIKRVSLELGGKSANILLDDADLATAVPAAVQAAMLNSGQTCSALTRLIVPRERLTEVEQIAKTVAESITVGDPSDENTVLGPLASRVQQDRVLGYIRTGIDEGARVVTGGQTQPQDGPGAYVTPTIFSDVTTDMTIHRDEIFGPVLAIEPYDTEDEAVAIANDSIYGLSGGVSSASSERAHNVARRMRTGQVFVNDAAWNLDAPFGGYKQSGVGREAGRFGLEEFLEVKAIQG